MPISTDNTRLSIDFGYEYESAEGPVTYQMKFLHSVLGPTVQILNGPYDPVELPAEMFTEVAEFLISQGVVKGIHQPALAQKQSQPLRGSLPMPNIARKAKAEPVQSLAADVDEEEVVEEPKEKVDPILKQGMEERMAAKEKNKSPQKRIKPDHKPDPSAG